MAVDKPVFRSSFRRRLGREYYILKRRLRWLLKRDVYARRRPEANTPHTHFTHRSMLLRPLRNVDMQLQHNKITNLRLAIARIDGVVLRPGERFSVWRMVGRPTRRKGYLDGLVLHNGAIGRGTGGGLCQLGNLLYWMALHTDLDVAERWHHSFDVFPDVNRTIPFACGATLAYNYIDLELHNPTPHTFSIHLWLDDEHLNGEIRCDAPATRRHEIFETDHRIEHQWWGAFTRHNRIRKRTFAPDGTIESERLVAENHAIMMYNPLLEN